jgi:O-succinylbenzoic acid--CoA ligase
MIYIHRYQLLRNQPANAKTTSLIQLGALIKYVDRQGNFGVSDLCPWPSLGDQTLQQELLTQGKLFRRALELAKIDLQARKNKIKLISDVVIKNHLLIQDYKTFDFKNCVAEVVKIKGDRDYKSLAEILNSLVLSNLQLRIDFNFCLSESQFRDFLKLLNLDILKKIETIEDPFPFELKSWTELNQTVCLSLDWSELQSADAMSWPHTISKPVRKPQDSFLYMTSSMDHPVGVAHGLAQAQKWPDRIHGFLTLSSYQPTEFHSAFQQSGTDLKYISDGFGIGFESLLQNLIWEPFIDWDLNSSNQLLMNPKTTSEEKNILFELSDYFDTEISKNSYLLIPSSGSSKSVDESVKLVALKKSAILSSAQRVTQQFDLNEKMHWGCVLPTFHVGGLGILARAHSAGSKVYFAEWKTLMLSEKFLSWISDHQIQVLSLVPAQIFDLVKKNIQCPMSIQKVFVGGSELSKDLAKAADQLKWPLIQTYGMTETASMVAFKDDYKAEEFQVMPGVHFEILQEGAKVSCDSLASYTLQKIKNKIQITDIGSALQISDQVIVTGSKIQFLGRADDRIQILSETVSLSELRSRLQAVVIEMDGDIAQFALVALLDQRSGHRLVLISEIEDTAIFQKFNSVVRPYERAQQFMVVERIPKTDLGKVKYAELVGMIHG